MSNPSAKQAHRGFILRFFFDNRLMYQMTAYEAFQGVEHLFPRIAQAIAQIFYSDAGLVWCFHGLHQRGQHCLFGRCGIIPYMSPLQKVILRGI